jgi:hypothetical protein
MTWVLIHVDLNADGSIVKTDDYEESVICVASTFAAVVHEARRFAARMGPLTIRYDHEPDDEPASYLQSSIYPLVQYTYGGGNYTSALHAVRRVMVTE